MLMKALASALTLALATATLAQGPVNPPTPSDSTGTKLYMFQEQSDKDFKVYSEIVMKPNMCYEAEPMSENDPRAGSLGENKDFRITLGRALSSRDNKCKFYTDKQCNTDGVTSRQISSSNQTQYNFVACERIKPTPSPTPTPTPQLWIPIEVGSCRSDIRIYSEPRGYHLSSLDIQGGARLCYIRTYDAEKGTCDIFKDKTLTQKYERHHVYSEEEWKSAYVRCNA
ncbi:hypothetical protein EC968_007108 [Mortierella alpina]|nr:hypothetical protein EC968_007108 [Mortierella alpina]